ncbi:MAG: Asp-tRNA(Asn)/Glu-tRNA(Gln) amidotransferase subunit GatC [Aestuariivita sp.]|nr:Asp-tRNA(Asn)/Glu-tRNA(Gln) amidotransferase subunit GatC [Aestuariivita sp.]MCY4202891.1 Asp-tRNA(Asn)/Glu-tRNA(Gln) amidotransferase subunit GatC [Aestuariivita sp.]MCY4289960.1 Asp-tRNA(Asn)/Glu-tRNA(Gln) amidotransferase subunit GatC [Aestuariivita sp.]MCY4346795.1 Asp-tRNA(Asn)/Glu-tRNA(Gln) amidotransferase subunit GatC [Aestuariivita sp.]
MAINEETVARMAKLARIKVDPQNLPTMVEEFSAILGFIAQLSQVDVKGIEPMVSVTPMHLKQRKDTVTAGDISAKILANAPDAREGFFAVPKVVE